MADETRGTKTSRHHPHPQKGKGGMEKGDRWGRGGRERRRTGRREVRQPPWPHTRCRRAWPVPLSIGPAAEIPALCAAQLARRQSCASSRLGSGKWGTRRAYGREARKCRAKPGWPLGPGTQMLPIPAWLCPLHSMEPTAPGLPKSPGGPAGEAWCWTPREPRKSHGLAGSSPSTWITASRWPY